MERVNGYLDFNDTRLHLVLRVGLLYIDWLPTGRCDHIKVWILNQIDFHHLVSFGHWIWLNSCLVGCAERCFWCALQSRHVSRQYDFCLLNVKCHNLILFLPVPENLVVVSWRKLKKTIYNTLSSSWINQINVHLPTTIGSK